jgi:hypothetical protein
MQNGNNSELLGYKLEKRIKPEHTCCDFHQQKCSCDDCVLSSAAQMLENVNSSVLDPSINILIGRIWQTS